MSLKRLAVHAALNSQNGQYHSSNHNSTYVHVDKSGGGASSMGHHQQGLQTMRSNGGGANFHGNVNVLLGG